MKKTVFFRRLPNFITLSALLHVGIFGAVLWSSAKSDLSPLPLGVEVQYGDSFEATDIRTVKATPQVANTVAVSDDSDAPVLDKKKEDKPQVAAKAASSEKFGNPEGNSEKGALTGRMGVANGTEVSVEERYIYELRKLMERRQIYPSMARKMGHTGTVTVRFTLSSDGSLVASEVVEKTPYESLNRAALETVKAIHGMKPFPREIQRASWQIEAPIEYSLN